MDAPIRTTTVQKIDAVTYAVISASAERATETLEKKVEKLLKKDMQEVIAKRSF